MKKVQIIESACPPLQNILQSFHSTLVINFIAWNKAYAIFPRSTFILRSGVALRRLNTFSDARSKYRQRSYSISILRRPDIPRYTSEIIEIRRPGDHLTWKLEFDTSGLGPPTTPDYVLEHCAFGFKRRSSCSDDAVPYFISAATANACVLRHQYTRPNCPDFFSSVVPKFDHLTLEQLKRLPDAMRPPSYDRMIEKARDLDEYRDELFDNNTPRLECYDDDIPHMYAEWERRTPRSRRTTMPPDNRMNEHMDTGNQ